MMLMLRMVNSERSLRPAIWLLEALIVVIVILLGFSLFLGSGGDPSSSSSSPPRSQVGAPNRARPEIPTPAQSTPFRSLRKGGTARCGVGRRRQFEIANPRQPRKQASQEAGGRRRRGDGRQLLGSRLPALGPGPLAKRSKPLRRAALRPGARPSRGDCLEPGPGRRRSCAERRPSQIRQRRRRHDRAEVVARAAVDLSLGLEGQRGKKTACLLDVVVVIG